MLSATRGRIGGGFRDGGGTGGSRRQQSIRRGRRTGSRISGGSKVGAPYKGQRASIDAATVRAMKVDDRGTLKALKIGRTSLGRSRSSRVLLGFLRIAAVEMPRGTAIQIFDDDVVAFTRLIALLLLISATFPYFCDCRLSDAEAHHADGNRHSNQCNSDTAQSLLPDVHRLSVPSLRSALAPLPGGELRTGHARSPCPT